MDKLLTVIAYYDGPRSGLCTFKGDTFFYESTWEDVPYQDGETDVGIFDRFMLARANPESESLSLELWESWKRWEAAHQRGDATLESHPALPEDRPRMLEAEARLHEIRAELSWTIYCRLVEVDYSAGEGAEAGVRWEQLETPSAEYLEEFRAGVVEGDANLLKMYSRPRTSI